MISDNDIGDEGLYRLSESLAVNDVLLALNLSGNRIKSDGAAKLSASLKTNTSLTRLNLSGWKRYPILLK